MTCTLHIPYIYDPVCDLVRCACGFYVITRVEADNNPRTGKRAWFPRTR